MLQLVFLSKKAVFFFQQFSCFYGKTQLFLFSFFSESMNRERTIEKNEEGEECFKRPVFIFYMSERIHVFIFLIIFGLTLKQNWIATLLAHFFIGSAGLFCYYYQKYILNSKEPEKDCDGNRCVIVHIVGASWCLTLTI